MSKLAEQLAALATMSPAQLRERWSQVHREPAPRLAPDLLRLGIVYRLQEKQLGGLGKMAARGLRNLDAARPAAVKPGTRFVRSWNGRTIAVVADDDGYLFEERRYRSLTAIAREVTGTSWSEPRFFGLRGEGARG